jgi:hypothetical protein
MRGRIFKKKVKDPYIYIYIYINLTYDERPIQLMDQEIIVNFQI